MKRLRISSNGRCGWSEVLKCTCETPKLMGLGRCEACQGAIPVEFTLHGAVTHPYVQNPLEEHLINYGRSKT